jgi:hypothetical protein
MEIFSGTEKILYYIAKEVEAMDEEDTTTAADDVQHGKRHRRGMPRQRECLELRLLGSCSIPDCPFSKTT